MGKKIKNFKSGGVWFPNQKEIPDFYFPNLCLRSYPTPLRGISLKIKREPRELHDETAESHYVFSSTESIQFSMSGVLSCQISTSIHLRSHFTLASISRIRCQVVFIPVDQSSTVLFPSKTQDSLSSRRSTLYTAVCVLL